MNIRLKLTGMFAGLFAIILLGFSLAIFFSNANQREEEYFKRLRQLAITKTNLLLGARVEPSVLQLIYKNSLNTLPQEEVAIFDTSFILLYHDAGEIDRVRETRGMIDSIIALKEIHFYVDDLQAIGFTYSFGGKTFVITAAAKDDDGLGKLRTLRIALVAGFAIAMLFVVAAGSYFSGKALEPLNDMVARLENSFESQKQFVSNISHELRTPLAAIIAELEISANRQRTTAEYQELIGLVLLDARKLSRLSNDLLDLAKASYDPSAIMFKELRPDEVLIDARQEVLRVEPGYRVEVLFEREIEEGDLIVIRGNEYLLRVAFSNLIENACKFSAGKQCTVSIGFREGKAFLQFKDRGIGIEMEDLPKIFTPFFRGGNKKYASGNGIGLSLTARIIHLHRGTITVDSRIGKGTVFTVTLLPG